MFYAENGKSPENKEEKDVEVKEEENHITIDSIKEDDNPETVEKEEKNEPEPKSRSASPNMYAHYNKKRLIFLSFMLYLTSSMVDRGNLVLKYSISHLCLLNSRTRCMRRCLFTLFCCQRENMKIIHSPLNNKEIKRKIKKYLIYIYIIII